MKKIMFLMFAFALIGLYSCQKQPTASFTASKTTATVGEVISFTNSSTEGNSFEWNFGDGGSSTEENPSHTFTTAGSFTVMLVAYSKNEKNLMKLLLVSQ